MIVGKMILNCLFPSFAILGNVSPIITKLLSVLWRTLMRKILSHNFFYLCLLFLFHDFFHMTRISKAIFKIIFT